MTAQMTPGEVQLCKLAQIVSERRTDLPARGLPYSLLSDLKELIPCDAITLEGFDSGRQESWHCGAIPFLDELEWKEWQAEYGAVHWEHYWKCKPCSYPDRSGDLRTVIKIADFYSGRQWHCTGMYADIYRPQGMEHELMLTLPAGPGGPPGPGRSLRLFLFRGPGPDFSEAERALLILLRPHLYQAHLDAERRRHPLPELTQRHWQLLDLLAEGFTNEQIARRLCLSEGTIRTHLENLYRRLGVTSRTAAVTRTLPGRQ